MQNDWISVDDKLPDELETVWVSNGKGLTTLGCIAWEDGWVWAVTTGIIYEENGKIVSECEIDDIEVKFWHKLPDPPKIKKTKGVTNKR